MKHYVVTLLAAVALSGGPFTHGQGQVKGDQARARELHRKVQSGEQLTAKEQIEYDRARQEFPGGRSKGRPARERGKVEVQSGVEFGTGGGRELKLDIVRTKTLTREPMPVVVFIHGGGWRGGGSRGGIAMLTSPSVA